MYLFLSFYKKNIGIKIYYFFNYKITKSRQFMNYNDILVQKVLMFGVENKIFSVIDKS